MRVRFPSGCLLFGKGSFQTTTFNLSTFPQSQAISPTAGIVKTGKFYPAIVIMRSTLVPAWRSDQFFEKFSADYYQKEQRHSMQLANR
jgi:hypothetical protein